MTIFGITFILSSLIICGFAELLLIEGPASSFGLEAQGIVLRCRFSSSENISVFWFHDEKDLTSNPEFKQHLEGSNGLHLSTLSFQLYQQQEGNYRCNGSTNTTWVASDFALVRMAYLEKDFILEPQDKVVSLGDTVLFECVPPVGLPKPSISWYKDNVSIILDERMQISDMGGLRIDRVAWRDSGTYSCHAQSYVFRRISSTATLIVRQRPYFVESPVSQSVPAYSSFELACRVAGDPLPTVFWKRDPPFLSIPFERTRLLPRGTLHFLQARLEDTGDYICRAVSYSGVIEATAHVTVVVPPGLTQTPPTFVSVLEGEKVELHCSAMGAPDPELRWTRDAGETYFIPGVLTPADRIWVSPSGSLAITAVRPEDTSLYECRASSVAGVTRTVTQLEVRDNPHLYPVRFGAVSAEHQLVRITNSSSTARIICTRPQPVFTTDHNLTVLWYLNGRPLHDYPVMLNKTQIDSNGSLLIYRLSEDDSGNYTCLISDPIRRRYASWTTDFRVISGLSGSTSVLSVEDLPSAPTNISLVERGDTWLSVAWSADPTKPGFAGYQVSYVAVVSDSKYGWNYSHQINITDAARPLKWEFGPNLDRWMLSGASIRKKHHKLTKLIPNTGYWVEIRTLNSYGLSYGTILPYIAYTLGGSNARSSSAKNLSHAGFPNSVYNGLSLSNAVAGEYKDLVSHFQSIHFEELSIRTLTSTELHVSWALRSINSGLHSIDGFKVTVNPVPITRCIAAVTSTYSDTRKVPRFSSTGLSNQNLYSAAHCSFSTDSLMEQLLRMSTLSSVFASSTQSHTTLASQPFQRILMISRSVSSTFPVMKTVSGGLHPFTCYEVEVGAFKDDLTYGRIWSRSSGPELALTLDSSPSHAPELISANWVVESTRYAANTTFIRDASTAVRIAWKPLEIRFSHGVIVAYMIHLLANGSGYSRSVKVPPDQHSRDIVGLNPDLEYTVYLSGVTCRGEGVRGPGYQLPMAFRLKSHLDEIDETTGAPAITMFPGWVYGVIVAVIIFWILLALLVPLLLRRHSCSKYRSRFCCSQWSRCWPGGISDFPSDSTKVKPLSNHSHLGNQAKSDRLRRIGSQDSLRNELELATLLPQSPGSSPISGEKPISNLGVVTGFSNTRHAHSVEAPTGRNTQLSYGLGVSSDVPDNDSLIYANSNPAITTDPLYLMLCTESRTSQCAAVSSQSGWESVRPPVRFQLPNAVNVPFPVHSTYQSSGSDATNYALKNREEPSIPVSCFGAFPSQLATRSVESADTVPPYASCTVLPSSRQVYSFFSLEQLSTPAPSVSVHECPHISNQIMDPAGGMSQSTVNGATRMDPKYPSGFRTSTVPYWSTQANDKRCLNKPDSSLCSIPPPPEYSPPPLPFENHSPRTESTRFFSTYSPADVGPAALASCSTVPSPFTSPNVAPTAAKPGPYSTAAHRAANHTASGSLTPSSRSGGSADRDSGEPVTAALPRLGTGALFGHIHPARASLGPTTGITIAPPIGDRAVSLANGYHPSVQPTPVPVSSDRRLSPADTGSGCRRNGSATGAHKTRQNRLQSLNGAADKPDPTNV